MPLFDKDRSLLDNISDVAKEHKPFIFLIVILTWMTKNKWIVFFLLLILLFLIDEFVVLVMSIFD